MGINESLDRITQTSSSISNTENLMPGIRNASDGGAELQSGDAAVTQRLATAGSHCHTWARETGGGKCYWSRGLGSCRGNLSGERGAVEEAWLLLRKHPRESGKRETAGLFPSPVLQSPVSTAFTR